MADIQLPAWAASLFAIGLPAAGWFGRTVVERLLQHRDRRVLRRETDLQERLQLLRHLNGDIYRKWLEIRDQHQPVWPTPAAEKTADEIATWLYKHSSYFPQPQRTRMVNLADVTFDLATAFRSHVIEHGDALMKSLWGEVRDYQRKVETKLGLE